MGNKILYKIETPAGNYYGKYSQGSTYMRYHFGSRAFPIEKGYYLTRNGWEKDWRADLQRTGVKDNQYIKWTGWRTVESVIVDIKQSWKPIFKQLKIRNSVEDMWWLLTHAWRKDDLETGEALFILLGAAADGRILNTQIDFLPGRGSFLSASTVDGFLAPEVFYERSKEKLNPYKGIYFNISLKNVQKSCDDVNRKVYDEINELLKSTGAKIKTTRINLFNQKVTTAIGMRFNEDCRNSMKKQIEKFIEEYSNVPELCRVYQTAWQKLNDYTPQELTSTSVATFTKDLQDQVNAVVTKHNEDLKATISKEQANFLSKFFITWLHSPGAQAIITNFSGMAQEIEWRDDTLLKHYKRWFANRIQTIVFKSWNFKGYTRNDNAVKKQNEDNIALSEETLHMIDSAHIIGDTYGFESGFFKNWKAFYAHSRDSMGSFNTESDVIPFIDNNWHYIYPEQAQLWFSHHATILCVGPKLTPEELKNF